MIHALLVSALLSPATVIDVEFPQDLIQSGYRFERTARSGVLIQGFSCNSGWKEIDWVRHERAANTPSDEWVTLEATYSTTYWITDVASREGGDEVYVAGIQPSTGNAIIEKWSFANRRDTWVMRSSAAQLSGPLGSFQMTLGLNGPASPGYVAPTRTIHESPSRTVLMRNMGIGPIRSLVVDPEGRYLLLMSSTTNHIYRVDLTANPIGAPVVELSSTTVPQLADLKSMSLRESTQGDRVIVVHDVFGEAESTGNILALTDAANDGVFETHVHYDKAAWKATAMSLNGYWKPLFDQLSPN